MSDPTTGAIGATTTARLGTMPWSARTDGQLTSAERRHLLRPLARTHLANAVGRTSMLLRLHSGRRAQFPDRGLRRPSSALTRAAEQLAQQRLSPALLHHSHRCSLFGVALGSLEQIDVDRELLFAAAMLHDVGLVTPTTGVDFDLTSARVAQDVAETVGLSAATDIVRSAITLHHSPGVTVADGPVACVATALSTSPSASPPSRGSRLRPGQTAGARRRRAHTDHVTSSREQPA